MSTFSIQIFVIVELAAVFSSVSEELLLLYGNDDDYDGLNTEWTTRFADKSNKTVSRAVGF